MKISRTPILAIGVATASLVGACSHSSSDTPSAQDTTLRALINAQQLTPLPAVASPLPQSSPLVQLGRSLFFDKAISGENDTSCSTCHQPSAGLSNATPLPIGPGGQGVGATRSWTGPGRTLQWRNSPGIVNRALPGWDALTFASQIHLNSSNQPTGVPIIYPIDTVQTGSMGLLEIQAHFPPTGRDNMLGLPDAQNTLNQPGSPLEIPSFDFRNSAYATPVVFVTDVWKSLTTKILQYPGYQTMFAAAYPGVAPSDYTFLHIGRAIAAFESAYFVFDNSPWDRYVRGDLDALTDTQKAGAQLFLTRGCSSCHSGAFFTDQQHHNIGVPPFGPGPQPVQLVTTNTEENTIASALGFPILPDEDPNPHLDFGRADLETGTAVDQNLFAVRTIPLHNVALTAPYFHNGTVQDLKSAVLYHLDAEGSLDSFDTSFLQGWLDKLNGPSTDHMELQTTTSPLVVAKVKTTIDPRVLKGAIQLSDAEVDEVVEFLQSLTDPALQNLPQTIGTVTTPSNLSVDM